MLVTTGEVIAELGGIGAVARLMGRQYDAVWVWRKSNKFPANTFVAMRDELVKRGFDAPPSLWGMS